jgi:hypothetical protein
MRSRSNTTVSASRRSTRRVKGSNYRPLPQRQVDGALIKLPRPLFAVGTHDRFGRRAARVAPNDPTLI